MGFAGQGQGALSAFALDLGLQVNDLFPSAQPTHIWPGAFGVQCMFVVADWHLSLSLLFLLF